MGGFGKCSPLTRLRHDQAAQLHSQPRSPAALKLVGHFATGVLFRLLYRLDLSSFWQKELRIIQQSVTPCTGVFCMKRRILLVDDEVAVLLTLKAVLEINGFIVETAASVKEAKLKLRSHDFHMVITDMRMESDESGAEVIQAARAAASKPAVALLTAFPQAEEDWREMGADEMLVKPMHTNALVQQIEALLVAHEDKKQRALSVAAMATKKPVASKAGGRKAAARAR